MMHIGPAVTTCRRPREVVVLQAHAAPGGEVQSARHA